MTILSSDEQENGNERPSTDRQFHEQYSEEDDALVIALNEEFAGRQNEQARILHKAPESGFADKKEFLEFVLEINSAMADDYAKFITQKDALRTRDPENPEKFISNIVTECADGRNSELQFMDRSEIAGRFDHEWLPFAGNIIFPEFTNLYTTQDWQNLMQTNPGLKEKFFKRLDSIYGHKIGEAVAEFRAGTLSRVNLEFQSHYDPENAHHGCGAHKSNLLAAQLESIKDCMVADSWLAERFPEEYKAGAFRVIHTTHDTSENGPVRTSGSVNQTLPDEDWKKYGELFLYAAEKFQAPSISREKNGIIREYKGNPFEIETHDHDEQSVRVSHLHYAATLQGQSVLEISWTDSPETLASHIKILLSIIDKNFRARHPDKPAILHFDLVKGDEGIQKVYREARKILQSELDIAQKLEAEDLIIVVTETDRDDYKMTVVE